MRFYFRLCLLLDKGLWDGFTDKFLLKRWFCLLILPWEKSNTFANNIYNSSSEFAHKRVNIVTFLGLIIFETSFADRLENVRQLFGHEWGEYTISRLTGNFLGKTTNRFIKLSFYDTPLQNWYN